MLVEPRIWLHISLPRNDTTATSAVEPSSHMSQAPCLQHQLQCSALVASGAHRSRRTTCLTNTCYNHTRHVLKRPDNFAFQSQQVFLVVMHTLRVCLAHLVIRLCQTNKQDHLESIWLTNSSIQDMICKGIQAFWQQTPHCCLM